MRVSRKSISYDVSITGKCFIISFLELLAKILKLIWLTESRYVQAKTNSPGGYKTTLSGKKRTHESMEIGAFERTIVGAKAILSAGMSWNRPFWPHESLDIGNWNEQYSDQDQIVRAFIIRLSCAQNLMVQIFVCWKRLMFRHSCDSQTKKYHLVYEDPMKTNIRGSYHYTHPKASLILKISDMLTSKTYPVEKKSFSYITKYVLTLVYKTEVREIQCR